MKIILSRKGFDAANGGCPSPILPDGTLLSMPIPDSRSKLRYDEIRYGGSTYADIWRQLQPRRKAFPEFCHLDPDIRPGVRKDQPPGWQPVFGQIDGAQTHLLKQHVGVGDLFLFFGRFRQTEWYEKQNRLRFASKAPEQHIVYGYLQIGQTVTGEEVSRFPWHPHADSVHRKFVNNTMYLPAKGLCIDGADTGLPGCGALRWREELVLTKPGLTRSKWALPAFFREVSISHHSPASFKDGYFESVKIGQELVVSEDPRVSQWAKALIEKSIET